MEKGDGEGGKGRGGREGKNDHTRGFQFKPTHPICFLWMLLGYILLSHWVAFTRVRRMVRGRGNMDVIRIYCILHSQ